jgi:secreted trypsin-like serine protease
MRARALIGGALAVATVAATAGSAEAIRYGEPDNGEHPYVGLMVAFVDGAPAWRCSGTLIAAEHFLTAGHCTFGADHVEIWFDEDLTDAALHSYPSEGDVSGTPHTHPDYDHAAFYLNDLGMVVLEDPYTGTGGYGNLPEEGYFDQFFPSGKGQTFTAVGYGLQRNMPEPTGLTSAERVRLQATLKIINEDAAFGEKKAGNSVLFTNNASTGGTCNGDSGGPIFVEGSNVVAAVTSYGLNARCAGTGGGYRVDTPDDLEWLEEEFGLTPG